ncbi:MAG: Cif family virulence factor [Myxococcaceae bacterium]
MDDSLAVRETLDALYAWISGPPGERDPEALAALFTQAGRLGPTRPAAGGCTFEPRDPEAFAAEVNEALAGKAFYEAELECSVLVFGNLAHAWSLYESRSGEGAVSLGRGVNSVQLLKQGGRWKVLSMVWDTERADNPLPRRYPP